MVTATEARHLRDGDVAACESFAVSPASTVCHYKFAARLVRHSPCPVLRNPVLHRLADGRERMLAALHSLIADDVTLAAAGRPELPPRGMQTRFVNRLC